MSTGGGGEERGGREEGEEGRGGGKEGEKRERRGGGMRSHSIQVLKLHSPRTPDPRLHCGHESS